MRDFPSDKPQIDEDRIGGSSLRLLADPLLYQREPFRRLMDIIAVGDVTESQQDLFQAFASAANRRPRERFGPSVAIALARAQQIGGPTVAHSSPSGSVRFTQNDALLSQRRSGELSIIEATVNQERDVTNNYKF